MEKLGQKLWRLSVALYLIVNGYFGIVKHKKGDFYVILDHFFDSDLLGVLVIIAGIIAFIAGVGVILNMLDKNNAFAFQGKLIFIVAIIWVVYVVLGAVYWIKGGFGWEGLQRLAVHLMVLSSLLIASSGD